MQHSSNPGAVVEISFSRVNYSAVEYVVPGNSSGSVTPTRRCPKNNHNLVGDVHDVIYFEFARHGAARHC